MKKYITIIAVSFTTVYGMAQVAVGKESITNDSVILEFNDQRDTTDGEAKGLVLPVSDGTNAEVEGAVWIDTTGVFKVYKSTGAFELSDAGTVTAPTLSEVGTGVIISDDDSRTSDAVGVLELESTTKAMILPHVNDVTTSLVNPQAGTWVYDSSKKAMAFFNGTQWEFNYGE